jgi:hypothetical protein
MIDHAAGRRWCTAGLLTLSAELHRAVQSSMLLLLPLLRFLPAGLPAFKAQLVHSF